MEPGFNSPGVRVKCPHCHEEIDMGLFGAGKTPRSPSEIRAGQSAARIADANASTRPKTVTVQELKNRGK
jgi:hypothetical protein